MYKYILALLVIVSASIQAGQVQFETYVESWKANSTDAVNKFNVIENTYVDFAFADLTFVKNSRGEITEIGGLEMPLSKFKELTQSIHNKGGKVKISFGGATYPYARYIRSSSDATYIALNIAALVDQFNLDGIDLDLEDYVSGYYYYDGFINNFVKMVKELKQNSPNTQVTLTVPGGSWFDPWTSIIPQLKDIVDAVSFMEYNIWIAPENTFVAQVQWDINYYQNLWGLNPNKVQVGLMPGNDDLKQNLSIEAAQELTKWAKDNGYFGVMMWDINRDYESQDGQQSGEFGRRMEQILQ